MILWVGGRSSGPATCSGSQAKPEPARNSRQRDISKPQVKAAQNPAASLITFPLQNTAFGVGQTKQVRRPDLWRYGNWDNRPPANFSGSDYGSSSGLSWTFGIK